MRIIWRDSTTIIVAAAVAVLAVGTGMPGASAARIGASAHSATARWRLAKTFGPQPPAALDGQHVTRVRVPYRAESIGPMAHDGHGGLWLAATPLACGHCLSTGVDMIHYRSAGTWARVFVPVPDEGVSIASMRLIPGTRSVWAAGQIGPPDELAAIFKYGP